MTYHITRKKGGIVFLCFLLVILSSCSSGNKKTDLRLAHGLDTNHPVHVAMVYMADQLDSISNGKMSVRIYPSGQLGSERESLELLQVGSLDMTKVSAAVMENFAPIYEVFSLPYLFENKEHQHHVLNGVIGEGFLNQGSKFRLKGLCFYDAGSRNFYTKSKPVTSPTDLEGMKIRVQRSKNAVQLVESLGGAPTPIPWGEIYTALQQGVVDGAENNLPSFFLSRHFEVCKYYSFNEHTIIPDVLLVGTSTWGRLSEQEKKWLKAAAKRSSQYQRKLWSASEKDCFEKLQAAGVEFSYPEKKLFVNEVKSMTESFKENPDFRNIIKQIKENKPNQTKDVDAELIEK